MLMPLLRMAQTSQCAYMQMECLTCTILGMRAYSNKQKSSSPTCTSSSECPATKKRSERRVKLWCHRRSAATFSDIASGSTKLSALAPGLSASTSSTKITSTMWLMTIFPTAVSVKKISMQRSRKQESLRQLSARKASRLRTSFCESFRIMICTWAEACSEGTTGRRLVFRGLSSSAWSGFPKWRLTRPNTCRSLSITSRNSNSTRASTASRAAWRGYSAWRPLSWRRSKIRRTRAILMHDRQTKFTTFV